MDTKTLCLGVLTLSDASGYDVRKQLMDTFAHFMEVSPNGVYPVLKELDEQGLVTSKLVVQEDRPNKTVYSITDLGRDAFVEGLAASPGRHKMRSEMLVLMYYAEHVATEQLHKILHARLEQLEAWRVITKDWVTSGASAEGTPGQNFISRYALAVMEAEIAFLRDELPNLAENLNPTKADRGSPNAARKKETT